MSSDQPSNTAAFRDQSTGLMLLGILQITIGGFCGLMALMSVVGVLVLVRGHVPGAPPVDPKAMIPGLGMYVAAAVVLIWLGIGSIQARRWAWSLTVVFSWLILINGGLRLDLYGLPCAGDARFDRRVDAEGERTDSEDGR